MPGLNRLRSRVVLFSSATCNLHCRYCNIDKNPVLKVIDNKLQDSFSGDYFFNRIKEYFQDKGQLKDLDIWGGEPFMNMERIYPTLHNIIDYYPYFKSLSVSTNFSFPGWVDRFLELANQFKQYEYRSFIINLQLSCDGPEYLNDESRGKGTTAACIKNFDEFISRLGTEFPSNVKLSIMIKQTLDVDSINQLQSADKVIEYYKFFEDTFMKKVDSLNYSNVTMGVTVPNTAVPSPSTKEDGINFAKLCRVTKDVEKMKDKPFKYYLGNLTPLCGPNKMNNLTYCRSSYLCGCASFTVGFLPDDMVSLCNESFTQLIDDYKIESSKSDRKNTATIEFDKYFDRGTNALRVNDEDYEKMERVVEFYCTNRSMSAVAGTATTILVLAMAGQIDAKYADIVEANQAANFFISSNYCIKDNINITGSLTLIPIGLIKLVLNGALDIMWEDSCQ